MVDVSQGPSGARAAAPSVPRLLRLADLLAEWEADAAAAHAARVGGIARGPISGLPALDQRLGGALGPGLHIVHGGPGVGKTGFALQIASTCGTPAVFVTAEMRPLELLRRVTARVTGTFLGRLRSGELAPPDSLALARRAVQAAPLLAIVDATQAYASPDHLKQVAAVVRRDAPHLLIVIDSLHSWCEAFPTPAPEYERLSVAIAALCAVAGQLGCPILAIAERNRASMASGGLSAAAGSRKFEYVGESVLELDVPEKGGPSVAPGETAVRLAISKNRNGPPGRALWLSFHGALQRFTDLDREA